MTLAADNDLWLLDLEHPVPRRLTFYNAPQSRSLRRITWSPDSKRIAYSLASGTASEAIHVLSTETSADTVLFRAPGLFAQVSAWSSDGRQLIALCTNEKGNFDIWTIPVDNPAAAARFLETPDYELGCTPSPDGRWLVCQVGTDDELQLRIYSMQSPGVRHQIVLERGLSRNLPVWSEDGRCLVLVDGDGRVLEVPVQLEGGFHAGSPRVLLQLPTQASLVAVTPDRRRFLVSELERQSNPTPLCVLMEWPQRLGVTP
jgi:Tol biopolymer transport system component